MSSEGHHEVSQGEEVLRLRMELAQAHREAAHATREHERLLSDLKEANENLILASLRSQELAEVAEHARSEIARTEHELREDAVFRERLMGMVGHDLRNPLAAISMVAGILARRDLSADDADHFAVGIRYSVRRMGLMIDQLLDFTRAHAGGGIVIEVETTDLRDLCGKIVEELELAQGAKGRFVCDLDGDLVGTWDPGRLAQVISNLGSNAIAHGARDRPIVLRARRERQRVCLDVSNQGDPIPPDLLPLMFDPFRRGRRGGGKASGLGLGLYISQQIVLAHGGSLTVRSTARQGTTFSVRLPRHSRPT